MPGEQVEFGALGKAHAWRQSQRRAQLRRAIHERVRRPIDQPSALRDPLLREESAVLTTLGAARLFLIAMVLHVLIVSFFLLVNRVVGDREARLSERVEFKIIETPQEPEEEKERVEETVVEEETPIAPDFSPVDEAESPPPKKTPRRELAPREKEPPRESAEPANPTEPVRRTVGLDFESTVSSGTGPAFAVGTSRMGKTDTTARDPRQAKRVPAGSGDVSATQRAATVIPTRDVEFVKPKRLRPASPSYPEVLKAQDIEGDVQVSVDIDEQGNVNRVTIVQGSGHAAFDAAARQAAMREKFSPARRDGKPVSYSITYTYRFRIDDD